MTDIGEHRAGKQRGDSVGELRVGADIGQIRTFEECRRLSILIIPRPGFRPWEWSGKAWADAGGRWA